MLNKLLTWLHIVQSDCTVRSTRDKHFVILVPTDRQNSTWKIWNKWVQPTPQSSASFLVIQGMQENKTKMRNGHWYCTHYKSLLYILLMKSQSIHESINTTEMSYFLPQLLWIIINQWKGRQYIPSCLSKALWYCKPSSVTSNNRTHPSSHPAYS